MAELTIIFDCWGHNELEEYLMSQKGIEKIFIKNEEHLEINIKYNPNLITSNIIKKEILLFVDSLNIPSLLAFDKHPTTKISEYLIIRPDICCDFCYKGAIEDLFEIAGIEKVSSNYNDYLQSNYDEREQVKINIKYNPDIISIDEMKQIESNLIL